MIKQLFVTNDNEPLSEKVFLTRMTVYITSIVLCLVAMSYCSFAFFSHSEIENTVYVTERFSIDVTAPDFCEELSPDTYRVNNQNDTPLDCEFVIKQSENNNLLGFCRVAVVDSSGKMSYFYTHAVKGECTVTVSLPKQSAATLKFVAQTGSCALPRIEDKIIIN